MATSKGQLLKWTELFSQYNIQYSRRDKWLRLAQYVSRITVLQFTDIGLHDVNLVIRAQRLESSISNARKVYRVFSSIDFIHRAFQSYHIPFTDQFTDILVVIANLAKAFWVIHDNLRWAGKIGLIQSDTKRSNRNGAWCLIVALVSLIIRDLKKIADLELLSDLNDPDNEKIEKMEIQQVKTDLLKNSLDLISTLASFDIVGEKLAAVSGLISTFISLKQEWSNFIS